jgi:hypothetical protein
MGLFTRNYFNSADEAKEFLISKVELAASLQNEPLNEHERRALNYAPDEPSTEWDLEWDQVRCMDDSESGSEKFEAEMISLLKAAYDRDREISSPDAPKYKSAHELLECEGSTNWMVTIAQQMLHSTRKTKIFGMTFES